MKAVLIDSSGRACSSAKIAEVQKYIDPATNGYTATVDGYTYTVGDGLGEGVANLGAHFTAVSAREIKIDVSFTADLASGFTPQEVRSQAQEAIAAYLKDLTLTTAAADDVVIRAARIGAIIIAPSMSMRARPIPSSGAMRARTTPTPPQQRACWMPLARIPT